MTAPSFNFFCRVDLNVRSFEDASLTTFIFVSKVFKDKVLAATDYWPILTGVGDIVQAAGEFLPSASIGTFTIDNTPGTFGAYRKFSDILQRYTPIDQTVVLYVAETTYLNDNPTSWTQVGQGICSGVEVTMGEESQSLTFSVSMDLIPKRIMTLQIDSTATNFTDTPAGNKGRTLPLIIGESVATVPVRITAEESREPEWAVATTYWGHAHNALTPLTVYTKNYNEDWESIGTDTSFADNTATASAGVYSLDTANTFDAFASTWTRTGNPGLATGCQLYAQGNGTGGRLSEAVLTVSVLRYDTTTFLVEEELAKGKVDLSDHDTNNNTPTASFGINVMFNKPVHFSTVSPGAGYALAVACTGFKSGELSLHYISATNTFFTKGGNSSPPTPDDKSTIEWKKTTSNVFKAKFLGLDTIQLVHSTPSGVAGPPAGEEFGYTELQFVQEVDIDDSSPGGPSPHFDNFPLIVVTNGLNDYDSTATGVANTILTRPDQLIKSLQYEWDGADWVDSGDWDFTTYSSAYSTAYATSGVRTRRLKGVIERRISFSELLEEICKNTASRIGVRQNGKLFLWPWGINQTPAANISHADITPLGWRVQDGTNIINRVKLNYERSYLSDRLLFEGGFSDGDVDVDYRSFLDYDAARNSHTSALAATSVSLFGRKELEEVQVDLIADSTAAQTLAEFYLAKYRYPLTYARIAIPYHRYKTLEMFDVINFQHTYFPAYYGTDPEATEPIYSPSDPGYYNLKDGYEWVRAESYRGLIEERRLRLFPDQAPILELTLQVLLNYPRDPT